MQPIRGAMAGLLLLLCAGAPLAVQAQNGCDAVSPVPVGPTCTRQNTLTASVAHVLHLDLSTFTTALLTPDLPQFDSTRVASGLDQLPLTTGPIVTVKANRPWVLKIMAATSTFSFTPDAVFQVNRSSAKPASDVAWSTNPAAGFVPLSASTASDIGSNPTSGSYAQFPIYYRTRWIFAGDVPGTYTLNISYTLTGT